MDTNSPKRSTKRRGYGEGSIYQRSDGRWCACVTVGYDAAGKRQRKVVYGETKKEVQDELTRLQGKKLSGSLVKVQKQTLAEYLTWWLENVAARRNRATTLASYETMIRVHIGPRLGGISLAKLQPDHILSLQSTMAGAGDSPRLQQLVYAVLHVALKDAMKLRKVARNVCDLVDRPRVEKKEAGALNPGQVAAFLKAAESDRLYALYAVAIASGLRFGELAGLQWSDMEKGFVALKVNRTLMEVKGKFILGPPKTKSGLRRVELPAQAAAALFDHQKEMLKEGHGACEFVFCDRDGNFLRRSNVSRRSFKPLLKAAGIAKLKFHELRHTCASLLLAKNVHPKIVQERMGHSQIAMTMDIYSHLMPNMQREAADALDDFLPQKAAPGA